jgi:two-component system, response regulator PdtaR
VLGFGGERKRLIRRLLIVEDEPLIAFDNEYLLRHSGYEVVATVDSFAAAEPLIHRDHIDAALLDVTLSDGGSGVDLARIAATRGVAVLFASGQFPQDAAEFAHGCLAKPYRPKELLAALAIIERSLGGASIGAVPPGLTLFTPKARAASA